MGKATLVIMAAGIGSRFGGGIKQLEPVGPNGEIIMDYSIYDALEAGFDKVVFVIRKDLEKDFKEVIGNRIEKKVEVAYAYQEVDDIPEQYKEKFKDRTKPWGTGQAILCCKDVVNEPFLVINADDYYGKTAYKEVYNYLVNMEETRNSGKMNLCMVGFILKNTLSDNGGVTRGVCKFNGDFRLKEIVETKNIVKTVSGAKVLQGIGSRNLNVDSIVSMNMWGFGLKVFDVLLEKFEKFLDYTKGDDIKREYLLPTIVDELLQGGKVEVRVLESRDSWFGVTYKEDKKAVVEAINQMLSDRLYEC